MDKKSEDPFIRNPLDCVVVQGVYIIPAADGCRIATMHYGFEAAEGFGRRFRYMLNTFAVLDRQGGSGLTDEQALTAVRNYCFAANPDLKGIISAADYPAYWEVASSDASGIVVLFRSYTGALVRYYVDRASGETYVTEFVQGITAEEQRTGETFNVKSWLSPSLVPTGTWQTATMIYQDDGNVVPEYYVQFTDAEVIYGHLQDGTFVSDHADKIDNVAQTANGVRVQVQASNGGQYTFRTCETDVGVLEYYETWDEQAFAEMYRAGASLWKVA